jgi:hypothetical protein
MYVIQATFQAKPGKAQALIDKLVAASQHLEDPGIKGHRVLVDHIADFWTVIFEATVEDLETYFSVVAKPAIREAMGGHVELVQGGHRRVYRMVDQG